MVFFKIINVNKLFPNLKKKQKTGKNNQENKNRVENEVSMAVIIPKMSEVE